MGSFWARVLHFLCVMWQMGSNMAHLCPDRCATEHHRSGMGKLWNIWTWGNLHPRSSRPSFLHVKDLAAGGAPACQESLTARLYPPQHLDWQMRNPASLNEGRQSLLSGVHQWGLSQHGLVMACCTGAHSHIEGACWRRQTGGIWDRLASPSLLNMQELLIYFATFVSGFFEIPKTIIRSKTSIL